MVLWDGVRRDGIGDDRASGVRLNICMLVYHYYPVAAGGAEHQCRLQALALTERGHACRVLTTRVRFSHPRRDRDQAVEIVRFSIPQILLALWIDCKKRLARSPKLIPQKKVRPSQAHQKSSESGGGLEQCLRWLNALFFMTGVTLYVCRHRSHIDVLHTHVASWNAGFAHWLGDRFGIPVVCKAANLPAFHNYGRSVPFPTFWSEWRRRGSFIALTEEMERDLISNGVEEGRIRRIPNGVAIPACPTDVKTHQQILCVGNFTQGGEHKGFDTLLAAWSHVHSIAPELRLVIAGGGDFGYWLKLADTLACEDSVVFLGHVDDLAEIYQSSGVFVLPSRVEGISNALLEAQSYGIPAVVTDIPGNREVVKMRKTGLLVSVDDAERLAEAILELALDADLRQQLGACARQYIQEHFSMERTVAQLEEYYQCLRQIDSQD